MSGSEPSPPQPWYAEDGLRFGCTGCGECCRRAGFVEVLPAEAERIATFLLGKRARPHDLEPSLWRQTPDSWEIEVPDGAVCPLLDPNGRCTIQEVKPSQCSTFPFWPEIVASPRTWLHAGLWCEGVGRGDSWDVVAIAETLRGRRAVLADEVALQAHRDSRR